ncbi:MAG: TrkH family potassium uptake protein [Deltaproteobacteria bacterium]|nr:TrkH family potassium uptake protein [Deltaproteobacteria bacterium]
MNWRALFKLLGLFSCVIALLIGISAGLSFLFRESEAAWLGLSALIPLAGGLGLMQFSWREEVTTLSHREATLLIALTWIVAIVWGAFPFYLTGAFGDTSALSFLNSLFESTSGFTATAASVLVPMTPLEKLSHGLLFWRALSQWLGGLSVVLMALLFLPFIRAGGMELFQTGTIARERLRTQAGETSRTVLFVYLGFTVFCAAFLMIGGMNPFDALCHAFAAVSSGGFSTQTGNVAAYNSQLVEIVLIVFMILGTTSFALHVSFVRKEWGAYFRSTELKMYLVVLFSAVVVVGWNLKLSGMELQWREVIFNTVSLGSTTGFWNADVSLWPSFAKGILLLLMFVGGTVGSTSGAIKGFRTMLLIKYAYRQVFRMIHPAGFTPVKLEGKVVEREVLEGVAAFFFLYILIFTFASLVLQMLGYDMLVAASAVASCLGGVGPGFNELGATGGYYSVPVAGKLTLMGCMLLGRVEIFPILVVLSREFWRK